MDNAQMAVASTAFKTLGELYDEPSEDEILARLKIAAASFLPDGWENWQVGEYFNLDLDPTLLNKLRFCLPAADIAKAFDPGATSLSERAYRDMKIRMLSWPFCCGLILGPPFLALQIRGSALHYELVNQSIKNVSSKLHSRKEASRSLGGHEESEPEETSGPPRKRRSASTSTSRLEALEQESKSTRLLLQEILNKLDGKQVDSSSDQEVGYSDGESSGASYEDPPKSPLKDKTTQNFFDFALCTKEQEPSIPEPDPELKAQGITCQRLGEESWNKIRYVDAQKKLHAAPVFAALAINPQLKHLCSSNDFNNFLEKTEGSYGTITHGLLLQHAAFIKSVNKIAGLCPPAVVDAISAELNKDDSDFRQASGTLLQFVCGKRAEAIEMRRKALTPINDRNVSSSLHQIPPSSKFLFDEKKLEELAKMPSSGSENFKRMKQYKRKFTSVSQHKFVPPAKKPKPQKKRRDNKPSHAGQDRPSDNKLPQAKKKSQGERHRRTGVTGRRF